jgi:putative addiction module component (TIGR02574 family)
MSANIKQVIKDAISLSADEKAMVAHCLISSLETKQDDGVDAAWAELAEQRFSELKSGKVKTISWQDIKTNVKAKNV